MTEDTHTTDGEAAGSSQHSILEAILAELEADDGTNAAALRRALDCGETTADRHESVRAEVESLRADIDDLEDTTAELRTVIENEYEPHLETHRRRIRNLEDKLVDVEAEMQTIRTDVTAARNAAEAISTGTDGGEGEGEGDVDVADLADDLADLERRVATAFDEVTSALERDLETLEENLWDDLEAFERRLDALEAAVDVDEDAERRD